MSTRKKTERQFQPDSQRMVSEACVCKFLHIFTMEFSIFSIKVSCRKLDKASSLLCSTKIFPANVDINSQMVCKSSKLTWPTIVMLKLLTSLLMKISFVYYAISASHGNLAVKDDQSLQHCNLGKCFQIFYILYTYRLHFNCSDLSYYAQD